MNQQDTGERSFVGAVVSSRILTGHSGGSFKTANPGIVIMASDGKTTTEINATPGVPTRVSGFHSGRNMDCCVPEAEWRKIAART